MTDEQQKAIEDAINNNPTGLMLLSGAKKLNVAFWTDKDISKQALYQNLLTGLGQNAIDNGILTKDEIIKRMRIVLEQRVVKK